MRPAAAALFALASLAGCSAGAPPGPPAVTALYAAESRLDPYPSDHFTRADAASATGLRVAVSDVAKGDAWLRAYPTLIPELEAMDGFSTAGGVVVRFDGEIDSAPLLARAPDDFAARGTPIALVDVDPRSPASGRAVPLVVKYLSSNEDVEATEPDFTLLVVPAVPLAPRTRYALVVSDAVRGARGQAVRASEATRALVAGAAEGEYGERVRAALPAVEAASGIARDRVVLATSFTTTSVHDDLRAVARAVREAPPPQTTPLALERPPAPGDARARFSGTFAAPEYRAPKPDGKWAIDAGRPRVRSTSQLEYFVAFSNAARSGPRPVVVLGHGLGRDKDQTWEVAEYLADLDVAVISIDAPEHGSRHVPPWTPGATDQVVSTLSFVGVDLDTHSIDVGVARDNFRQLASDQLHLFRLLASLGAVDVLPIGAPDGVPDLDPSRVVYVGVSFGAVIGSTALAFSPEARAASLSVGGAALGTVMRDSPTFRILMRSIQPPGPTEAGLARFTAIAQAVIDPGDPINYAPYVARGGLDGVPGWRGTDVLLQEAMEDNIIPNSATAALARALGLVQLAPVKAPVAGLATREAPLGPNGSAPTGGLSQFDRAAGEPTNHRTFFGTPEARKQYVAFLRSALAGPRATISSAYP
jgi:alpha-beta hydrolase superfamily lysophospholipase